MHMNIGQERIAPGWPGIPPRWTSSSKTGVGTSLVAQSRVWFTLSHGILNEIYFPRVDQACTRDQGFLVTDGKQYFSEEKRDCTFESIPWEPGIPLHCLTNTSVDGRYQIKKEVLTDPYRNVVLQKVRFLPLQGALSDYHLYSLLAPHLANYGYGNTAWCGQYKGSPMLFAQRDGVSLAVACSVPWRKMSVGFVGVSDGWQDLSQHYEMQWEYTRAENGNVALTGEIDLAACNGEFFVAIGFGSTPYEAGQLTASSLFENYDLVREHYVTPWKNWHTTLFPADRESRKHDLYRASAAILRSHESKDFLGGTIASLSIPWGFNKGDDDLGGYHLVWPRDLVEVAGGFLAAGAVNDALRVLRYLEATQEAEGNWAQNLWLNGEPYWNGIQMDETALPILLVDLIRRKAPDKMERMDRWWPMVGKAAGYLVRTGPVTQQDRWEEDAGYSPFTLATEIAALLAAADIAELAGKAATAQYLRDTADIWNDNVERWCYAEDSDLARNLGVDGYYVRIAPPEAGTAAGPIAGLVLIKNRIAAQTIKSAAHVISPDSLALVRFGLRAPDDPRILNTVKVIDALLRVDLPQGSCWYRYNGDGYGEHEDGSPFDGTGIGRLWPLLTGERGHYELAAGKPEAAESLLAAMERFTNGNHLIPEQIWDSADIPKRELFLGRPSGSACPLVWAHAEYIKLRRSLLEGEVFDQPPQTVERYQVQKMAAIHCEWRYNNKTSSMMRGKVLRISLLKPALVHWSTDRWATAQDTNTLDFGLGTYVVDLPTKDLPADTRVCFTFYWHQADEWEGADFEVVIKPEEEVPDALPAASLATARTGSRND
ncbi:MAG TPA: glucan 1,4-alpha-glucosidase [Terriglobales bacterium]|nr:glucan 1,4-alpha-glucosidase [Terriglobales bacterium]